MVEFYASSMFTSSYKRGEKINSKKWIELINFTSIFQLGRKCNKLQQ